MKKSVHNLLCAPTGIALHRVGYTAVRESRFMVVKAKCCRESNEIDRWETSKRGWDLVGVKQDKGRQSLPCQDVCDWQAFPCEEHGGDFLIEKRHDVHARKAWKEL